MPIPDHLAARIALGLIAYLCSSLIGALFVGRFIRAGHGPDVDHELPEGRA